MGMKWLWGILVAGAAGAALWIYARGRKPAAPGLKNCAQVITPCADGFIAPTPCGCASHGGAARTTPPPLPQPQTPTPQPTPPITIMPVPSEPPPGVGTTLPHCNPDELFQNGRCVPKSPPMDQAAPPPPAPPAPIPPKVIDALKGITPQPATETKPRNVTLPVIADIY
ncbi:hypothetical protein Mesil_1771 [Allomeiothermus silvanus DSM 9946]|uniref:Uncharacterized protein n=1 Tax=Allomeiothermus silvanus (strain ATCC 700542 / DSM 9946 / NBRC 106475 / NCIMB 13440 / VI-R2) TaxID=526227 RepID=D7BFU6_ALLS1|nr:hypothetical protein [Allomeiothermus silvanus]ADH63649.1 hypothetical protein Mesil_1771 [Allomeiothermus silvanus DSM 9946]